MFLILLSCFIKGTNYIFAYGSREPWKLMYKMVLNIGLFYYTILIASNLIMTNFFIKNDRQKKVMASVFLGCKKGYYCVYNIHIGAKYKMWNVYRFGRVNWTWNLLHWLFSIIISPAIKKNFIWFRCCMPSFRYFISRLTSLCPNFLILFLSSFIFIKLYFPIFYQLIHSCATWGGQIFRISWSSFRLGSRLTAYIQGGVLDRSVSTFFHCNINLNDTSKQ